MDIYLPGRGIYSSGIYFLNERLRYQPRRANARIDLECQSLAIGVASGIDEQIGCEVNRVLFGGKSGLRRTRGPLDAFPTNAADYCAVYLLDVDIRIGHCAYGEVNALAEGRPQMLLPRCLSGTLERL